MTTKFVYSGAAGANDGSSWTDAWTSIASATGVAAGTLVLLASDHSETFAAGNQTLTFTNGTLASPIYLISASRATSLYLAGALIAVNTGSFYTLTLNGHLRSIGVNWHFGFQLTLDEDTTAQASLRQVFEDCTIAATWNANNVIQLGSFNYPRFFDFNGVTIDFNGAVGSPPFRMGENVNLRFRNSSIVNGGASAKTMLQWRDPASTAPGAASALFEDCDLSAAFIGSLVDISNNGPTLVTARRCKINSSLAATSGTKNNARQFVLLEACKASTLTVPALGLTSFDTYFGQVKSDLARYRTGGADDGEQANAYSWSMTSNANALPIYNPLVSPPITRWVAAGSQTLTIFLAGGVSFNNDEFWVELESPSEAGTATAQGTFRTTRCDPLATPTALSVNHLTSQTDIAASATGDKFTSTTANKFDLFLVGQQVVVSGFSNAANNGTFKISSITSGASPALAVTKADGSAANLTTEAAGNSVTITPWQGTGVGVPQMIRVPIAPTIAGPVTLRGYLAKASATAYLDPLIDVA